MTEFNTKDHSHTRYNPLLDEWIIVSPHRAKRPWSGQEEAVAEEKNTAYDDTCYLCPGNKRANGEQNPHYSEPFVFTNDFSALLPDVPAGGDSEELFKAKSEKGICKVICFSPRHDLTLPEMEIPAIEKVISIWQNEYIELGKKPFINHVQIFENKGSVMGCSNPHPHGQIWAQESIPSLVKREDENQKAYYNLHGRTLLETYIHKELEKQERIVFQNDSFIVLVPYWATWPFEIMIVPKNISPNISNLSPKEKTDFAHVLKQATIIYDNVFNISFPYSAGIHQSPTNNKDVNHWCWHMHFYPPLLRSATIKKFMVGYEMLATQQRDITPEQSAEILRQSSLIHYKEK